MAKQQEAIICNLPVFPGREPSSTETSRRHVYLNGPAPSLALVEVAWCVTLHLYTGLSQVCFGVIGDDETMSNRACEVQGDAAIKYVAAALEYNRLRGDERQHHYNTCIVVGSTGSHDEETTGILQPGIQIAVEFGQGGIDVAFRRSFISAEEARNITGTFSHVFAEIVDPSPLRTVRNIGFSRKDLASITRWNSRELVRKDDSLAHERFSSMAMMQPDAQALDSWDGHMTYRELDATSSILADRLVQDGVGPGSWVIFCFHKSRWAIISMLAILKAGGACVPLDPRQPEGRVRQVIERTKARHALVGASDTSALLSGSDPDIQIIDVTNTGQPRVGKVLDLPAWPELDSESPAIGIFTSGSTGIPKGIIVPHAVICSGAWAYSSYIGADSETRILQFASYTFDVCMADVFTALLHGGTLCIPSEEDRLSGLQEYISRVRPNWAALTPTVARLLEPSVAAASVVKLLLVGELVRESDVEGWIDAGVEVYNVYGPAENVLITTAARTTKGRASNVGTGVNTRTWVVDVEKECLLPVGAVGELLLEGPHVAPGYLNDRERTDQAFLPDLEWIPDPDPAHSSRPRRFYRSGDLVRYCADGSLVCVGRADAQVKLGGQRVELGDIESHIQSYNATVLVPRAGPLRNRLTAVVRQTPSSPHSEAKTPSFARCQPKVAAAAAETLRKSVPSYMVPSCWIGIDSFPSSASGKLDRKGLTARLETVSQQEYEYLVSDNQEGASESENDLETDGAQQMLREICGHVLNLSPDNIKMNRSFAGQGGDSITAMQVAAMMKRDCGKTIGVRELLSSPSLSEAALQLRDLSSAPVQLPLVEEERDFPLTPIQRLFMDTSLESRTWNHYNQSVLLRLQEPRDPSGVEHAIARVLSRHSQLRTRFRITESGEWMQRLVSEEKNGFQLEFHTGTKTQQECETMMLQARQTLNITEGPILRAQLFVKSDGMLLFMVAHHLIVDLVSWRVILEDVEALLTSKSEEAKMASLQLQTIPFVAWSELQLQASADMHPDRTIPQGPLVPGPDFSYWGIDPGQNVYRDVREKRLPLGEFTTKNVLYGCHNALNTEPVDIFLASILLSFKRAFPDRPTPPVFNEGHGREPWNANLDVSRTVGWFTTMFPVYVSEVNTGSVADLVRRVKDWRKGCASNGFQYFSSKYLNEAGRSAFKDHIPAEIMFNYEGRYQAMEKQDSLLRPEGWTAGEALSDSDPLLQRFCLFELSTAVLPDGELHLTVAWNSTSRHQDRIGLWLTRLLPAVIDEVATSLTLERRQLTLSDIGDAGLRDYDELEALMESILNIPGVQSIDDIDDVYSGSPMQDSLILSQSRSDVEAYEIEFTWEVTPSRDGEVCASSFPRAVDPQRLIAAWNEVVDRHAALRTVLLEAETTTDVGMVHQVVLKRHQPHSVLLHAEDTAHALKLLDQQPPCRRDGVLLDMKPPHQLIICTTAMGSTFARFQINHAVFDGMSIAPLLRDLSKAYQHGRQIERPRRWNPFGSFVRYIRDRQRRDESISYWKDYLTGAEPCLLPPLHEEVHRASTRQARRHSVPVELEVDQARIQCLLRDVETTASCLFQLVWALMLQLYVAESRVVFGYLASGRDFPAVDDHQGISSGLTTSTGGMEDVHDAVGPFISMLVSFVDLESYKNRGLSLASILKEIQSATINSMSHQSSSLADIQNAIGSPQLFNTGMAFMPKMTKDMQVRQGSSLIFDLVALSDPTEFDLSLIVETAEDGGNQMSLHLEYKTSAISDGHAINIARSFSHMLSGVVRDPHKTLDSLSSLSQADVDQIWSWNRSIIASSDICLHEAFERQVMAHPESEAVYSWDGSLSYRELNELAARLGKHLVQSGVVPGRMVPICMEKSMWTIVAVLAVLKAGGCFVLLDPGHPEARLWHIIEEIDAFILLCSTATKKSNKLLRPAHSTQSSPGLHLLEVDLLNIRALPPLKDTDLPGAPICTSVSADDIAYVVYTSGTTGTPKGAVVTHSAVLTGLEELAQAAGMAAMGLDLRTLQFASFSFDASIGDIFATILMGGCICLPSEEDRSPADLTDFMRRARCNFAGITPSLASMLDPASVPTLRSLCLSGEPLPASQIEAWVDRVRLTNMYGPTECSIACIANAEISLNTGASNIGRGFRGATWIVDENNHERLRAIGTVGELLIEGPILARGYLKRPEQTAQAFIESPPWLETLRRQKGRLYKTGDLVRYNPDGTITYIGRKDTQIKINGQRVEIGEIEHVLSSALQPSSASVVVELLKREQLREDNLLVALVCVSGVSDSLAEKGAGPYGVSESIIARTPASLSSFNAMVPKLHSAASSLPRFMAPQAYVPIEKLPLTTSGKVDRRMLQRICGGLSRSELVAFSGASISSAKSGPDTGDNIEGQLARLWKKVLRVDVSGKQSNFFRLGGDSIAAMNLRAEARRIGLVLSVADIFANPMLADMARLLDLPAPSSSSSTTEPSHSGDDSSQPSSPPHDPAVVQPFSLLPEKGLKLSPDWLKEIAGECGLSPADIEDVFPCTPMQEGLMASSAHQSRRWAYSLHAPFKLPRDLDLERFQLAWEKTTVLHSILRSRMVSSSQCSLILVTRQVIPVRQSPTTSLSGYLQMQTDDTFGYGSPLFRLGLIHDGDDDCYYFVISAHHALYDGWSMKLLWDTALGLYHDGMAPYCAPSFQSFVEQLQLTQKSASQEYWRQALSDFDEDGVRFPKVPASHMPVASDTRSFRFAFYPEVTSQVGITATTLINAAWAIVLSQYTNNATATFGVTLSGRDYPMPDIEHLVGPTLVTIPRQINIVQTQSVSEFLQGVQSIATATLAHQHMGLHEIRALGQTVQKACDFSSLLLVNTNQEAGVASPLEEANILPIPTNTADFHPYPIAMECNIEGQALVVNVAYDSACIDEAMVGHVMRQFDHVLQNISRDTTASRSEVSAIMADVAPTHLSSILEWNKQSKGPSSSEEVPLVHQLVEQRAWKQPKALAVTSHDGSLSYEQLNQHAEWLSYRIAKRVSAPSGDSYVGLCFDKSAAAVISMLAVLKSGCAFIPLGPSLPPARLESLLEKAGVRVILTSPQQRGFLSSFAGDREIISVELSELAAEEQKTHDASKSHGINIRSDSPAYLLFTSGTTGQPKGVVVEHRAWYSAIAAQMEYFGLTPQTRFLQFSSYTFDVSLYEIFLTLCSGGSIHVPSEHSRVNDLAGYIRSEKINSVALTPTVARVLRPDTLPSLNLCLLGGEALAQSDIDAWVRPGRVIINSYGPTEACIFVCGRKITPACSRSKASSNIGQAVGATSWIVDHVTGALSPIGAVGELCIEGPSLARGYLNDEERTKASFMSSILDHIPGPGRGRRVYRTGDLVRYDADGTLNFVGRRDAQVKLRGHRIDLGEIEHNIHDFMIKDDSFHHATVQLYTPSADGLGLSTREPQLAAFLAMDFAFSHEVLGIPCSLLSTFGSSLSSNVAKELRRRLRAVLPEYMVPSVFVAVSQLPTTSSGKLESRFIQTCVDELSKKHPAQDNHDHESVWAPREVQLREWWASILGIAPELIAREDNFFALGGNSISAIRLVGLARSHQFALQYEDIFSYPELLDMATHIQHSKDGPQEPTTSVDLETLFSEEERSTVMNNLLLLDIPNEVVEDIYPCTPLQESLMAATARHPGTYMLIETIDIAYSQLDRFKAAWASAIRTFEMLRTQISIDPIHGAVQIVLKDFDPEWKQFSNVQSFIQFAHDSHDYGKPLMHLAMLPVTGDSLRVACSVHHALYDGWSVAMIWKKIHSEMSRAKPELRPTVVTPFKKFIRHLKDQSSSEAAQYWQQRLASISHSVFPADARAEKRRRPLATGSIRRSVDLPPLPHPRHLRGKIATVAHAAWALTISHYTANTDTVFGTILSGRESTAAGLAGIESIAGPTITTIPSRVIVEYDRTVSEFLTTVQQGLLRDARFSHLGLKEISRIDENCHQSCQLDSIFVVQPPASGEEIGDQTPSLVRMTVEGGGFYPIPLVVDVQPSHDGQQISANFGYDPSIVQEKEVSFMLDTFITLMRNIFDANPDLPLESLGALSVDHTAEIKNTNMSSDPEKSSTAGLCLHQLVRRQVESGPFLTAIEGWDGSITYAQLDDLSTSLGERLSRMDIGPEKAVCLLFEKSMWAIVAMLGVIKAGGCFVPLNPVNPVKRLQYLVQTVNASLVLTSPQNAHLCSSLSSRKVMTLDDNTLPKPTDAFLKPPLLLPAPINPRSTAYVLFTSGSTGLPKGVVVDHRALCSSLVALTNRMDIGSHSRILQFNAYWFDGMLLEIFGALISGGTVCIPSDAMRMDDLAGCIESLRANTITTLATSVSRMIDPASVPSLKTVCIGGEAVLPSDRDRWASKVRLLSVYGPTETCIIMLVGEFTPDAPATLLGEPVGSRVWIVNPIKPHELAPLGAVGELYIEGPNLAREYLGDQQKTAAAFIVDPPWLAHQEAHAEPHRLYRTGDLVRRGPSGTVTWVGRKDTSQVKISGQRVELAEIEEAIREHIPAAITVAADVFTPDDEDGRQILAAVLGLGSVIAGCSESEMADYMQRLTDTLVPALRGSLPSHMVPSIYVPLSHLPTLSTGKMDRKALRDSVAHFIAAPARSTESPGELPTSDNEKLISDMWADVLRLRSDEKITGSSNFFKHGGDSMMAMRLVALARHRGFRLTVVEIFENQTVSAMAAVMRRLDGAAEVLTTASNTSPKTFSHDAEANNHIEDSAGRLESKDALSPPTRQPPVVISQVDVPSPPGQQLPVAPSQVEAFAPCTSYQEVFMTGTEVFPGAHVTQWLFSLDGAINMTRLKAAVDRCVEWFPTFRTRIIRDPQSGRLVQAVLHKGNTSPWAFSATDDLESVLAHEKATPPRLGELLHRIHVVQDTWAASTHLVWTMNHAAYDAWSLGMMLVALRRSYMDPYFQPDQSLSFGDFSHRVGEYSDPGSLSSGFWRTLLTNSRPAQLLFEYPSIGEPRQDRLATFEATVPRRGGTTTATLITAAWILLLARLTNRRDIIIAYLVTGRTISLDGIDVCPGPAISKIPLRVKLPELPLKLPSLSAVADLVRQQVVRSMPHEHAGLAALRTLNASRDGGRHAHAGTVFGRLPLDLAIHPAGHAAFDGGDEIGMKYVGQRVMAPPPGAFSVECSIAGEADEEDKIKVNLAVIWDSRAASKDEINEVVKAWKEVFREG